MVPPRYCQVADLPYLGAEVTKLSTLQNLYFNCSLHNWWFYEWLRSRDVTLVHLTRPCLFIPMSSLAFSRILSAYRPVRTFKDLFHPVSSIRHLSPSTMPNDLNNAATELKPKDLWSERAEHAVDSITSQPPLNPYSGVLFFFVVQFLLFMSSSRSHCCCNEKSWWLAEGPRWDPSS